VRLQPKTAIAIALALHELATNAVKYGALSTSTGRVDFTWRLSKGRGPRDLTATWREIDGPRVSPPTRAGFGTRLIERGLAADLNGEVRIEYPVDGVVCTIRARLDSADGGEAAEPLTPSRLRRPQGLEPMADAAPPG
jgi:two-component sensor histidine kinase